MLWDFLSQLLTSYAASPSGRGKWKYGKVRYNLKLRIVTLMCTSVFLFITAMYLISQRSEGYSPFVVCVFTALLVLGIIVTGMFCVWKIDYDEEKIIYRTAYGRTYRILYEEITSVYSNPLSHNGDGEIKIISGKIKIVIPIKDCIGAKEFLYFCRKNIPFQL